MIFVTVLLLLLWLPSCFSVCRALWFSSAEVPTFSLSVLSFTHTQPQTHMNNVSAEEIAAGWQRRWFPAAIQNSLGEGEGGQHLHIKLRLCSSKEDWGRTENGSYLNSSRSWDESASKHGFTMIWAPSLFSHFGPKGKGGKRGVEVIEGMELCWLLLVGQLELPATVMHYMSLTHEHTFSFPSSLMSV